MNYNNLNYKFQCTFSICNIHIAKKYFSKVIIKLIKSFGIYALKQKCLRLLLFKA